MAIAHRAHRGDHLIRLVRRLVREKKFDPTEFVLAGSARLIHAGVLTRISDIDMVAQGRTLDRAFELTLKRDHGGFITGENTGDKIAQLYGGRINVSERWLEGWGSTEALIEQAEEIDGLRYFRIADVVEYKRALDRPKDREDLLKLNKAGHTVPNPDAAVASY